MIAVGLRTALRTVARTALRTAIRAALRTAAGRPALQAVCGLATGQVRFADLYPRRGSGRE
jgi:hypothetical protein